MILGPGDRLREGREDLRGRLEVGQPLREVDPADFGAEAAHLPDDRFAEGVRSPGERPTPPYRAPSGGIFPSRHR